MNWKMLKPVRKSDDRMVYDLATAIHFGLGGNGWAYSDCSENEMVYKQKELMSAAEECMKVFRFYSSSSPQPPSDSNDLNTDQSPPGKNGPTVSE